MSLAETLCRNADPGADWETPLGQGDPIGSIRLSNL
jgi:hypothetical protein